MALRALLFTFGLGCLVACTGVGSLEGDCVTDGGDGGELDCPARGELDGGVTPPQAGVDGGPGDNPHEASCRILVEDTCGLGDPPPCADAPSCVAAKLLQAHVPEECSAALANDVTYPACRPGPCALLVDRVCGGQSEDAACRDAPGCDPARVLLERSTSTDAGERADAEASCNAALEDDIVFAQCS